MIKIAIDYSHDSEEDARKLEGATREGLKTALVFWQRNFAKEHFEPSAMTRYRYQLRTKGYMLRKARQKHHQRPLVWSGTLREMVLNQFPQPRVTRNGGTLKGIMALRVPTYTYFTKTKSGTPSPPKYDELVSTADNEADTMARILLDTIDRIMSKAGIRRKVA